MNEHISREVFDMHRKECFRRHDVNEAAIRDHRASVQDNMDAIRKMVTGIIIAFSVTTFAALVNALMLLRGQV